MNSRMEEPGNHGNKTDALHFTTEVYDIVSNIRNLTMEDPNNHTDENYILCSTLPFDKVLGHKLLQLSVCYFTLIFLVYISARVTKILRSRENLQIPGNALILIFIVSDIILLIHRVSFVSLLLIKEDLIIEKMFGYVEAFFHFYLCNTNLFCISLLSVEKLLYINYMHLHMKAFCSLKMTVRYAILGCFVFIPYSVLFHYCNSTLHFKSAGLVMVAYDDNPVNILFASVPACLVIISIGSSLKIFIYAIKRCTTRHGTTVERGPVTMDRYYLRTMFSKAKSIMFPVVWICTEAVLYRLFLLLLNSSESRLFFMFAIVIRIFHPLFLIGGNKPLRNAVLNRSSIPLWLQDIQQEIMARRSAQNNDSDHNMDCLDNMERTNDCSSNTIDSKATTTCKDSENMKVTEKVTRSNSENTRNVEINFENADIRGSDEIKVSDRCSDEMNICSRLPNMTKRACSNSGSTEEKEKTDNMKCSGNTGDEWINKFNACSKKSKVIKIAQHMESTQICGKVISEDMIKMRNNESFDNTEMIEMDSLDGPETEDTFENKQNE